MNIIIPKKIILKERRTILQKKIQKLFDYWYSGVELWELTKIPSNELTSIAKIWDQYPISIGKADKYLLLIEKIINSLR